VMGFGVGHVWKTTNGGASWTNISGNLPDAPANTVLLDPLDHSTLYVGTDVGVFISQTCAAASGTCGASWAEYGSRLPNSTVMKLRAFNGVTNATRFLRAATYGRGVWQVPLASVPLNGQPALSSLAPNTATAGGAGFTLTVNGSGFVSGATVQWNGNNRNTTFVSATQLTAAITAADVAAQGTAQVTVVNPSPCSTTCVSAASSFTINAATNNPAPVLSNISPGTAQAGGAQFTLTVNGSSFTSGASTVQWNGTALATTFVSSKQLTATVPAANIAAAGSASVTVVTSTCGTSTCASGAAAFTITTTAFPTLAFPSGQTRYWPHLISTGGFITKMTVSNIKTSANSLVIYFLNASGTLQCTVSNTLAAGGTLRLSSDQMACITASSSAIVNSQGPAGDLAVNLFFEFSQNGSPVNTIGFNDQPPLTDMTMPVELQSPGKTIGMAIFNPDTAKTATVTVELLDINGNVVATATRTVGPLAHDSFDVLNTLATFATAVGSSDFIGSITLASRDSQGGLLAVTAMALQDDLGPFSALPPVTGKAK